MIPSVSDREKGNGIYDDVLLCQGSKCKICRRLFALRQGSVILNGKENEQMNLGVYVGIAAILFASACTSLDNGVQQSKQKTTVGQRVERFAKSLTQTATDVTSDVLPILTATTNEIVHEVKSDLPKVA